MLFTPYGFYVAFVVKSFHWEGELCSHLNKKLFIQDMELQRYLEFLNENSERISLPFAN